VAALCTFVVMMNCSVYVAWLNRLASGSGWLRVRDLGLSGGHHKFRLKFRSTTESSSQVPLTFRLLIYSSTSSLRRLPGIMSPMFPLCPLSDGQTCLMESSDELCRRYCRRRYCCRR